MFREIAKFSVKPGDETLFEADAGKIASLIAGAPGCRSVEIHKSHENKGIYYLFAEWENVADHVERFTQSAEFKTMAGLLRPRLSVPAVMEHGIRIC